MTTTTPSRRRHGEETTHWKDADDEAPFHDQLPSVEEIRMSAATRSSKKSGSGIGPVALICLVAIAIVALIIGLSVGLAGGGKKADTSASTNTDSGGGMTVKPEVSRLVATIKFLSQVSDEQKLTTLYTPQSMAAQWIAEKDERMLEVPSGDYMDNLEFVERYIIAVFYFSLNGPQWDLQLGFLGSSSICDWQDSFQSTDGPTRKAGIGCNQGRLADLHLPGNRLKGSIPSEFGFLSGIWSLNLNSNQITGTLPPGMQSMTTMALLALQHNELTGTIPSWLGKFDQMAVLYLGNNKFSSSLPNEFSQLTSLQSLALSKNELTGDLASLESLPLLTHVYADRNLFEGTLEDTFKFIPQMIELDMSSNRLRGTIPDYLFEMTDLEILDLHDNTLEGQIPDLIPEGSKLKYFAVHSNRFDGTMPSSIGNAVNMTHVDLSANYLQGTIPTSLGNLVNLKYLFLAENRFTEAPVPEWIQNLKSLEDLGLKETGLVGTIPSFLRAMPSLVLLDLQKNSLTGSIPVKRIGSGTSAKLRFILLNKNELSGSVPEDFQFLSSLDMLLLDHNKLTGNMDGVCSKAIVPRILSSDCHGAVPEVRCDCCTICCSDDTPQCNDEPYVGNIDPIWENSFVRKFYEFGPSITFDGSSR